MRPVKKLLFLALLACISACVPTITPTPTPTPTRTPTGTLVPSGTPTLSATFTRTNTPTPSRTLTPTRTGTPGAAALKYYLVDRVLNTSDFATLAGWGIDTAVVSFDVNGSAAFWQTVFMQAQKAAINIVVWPSDWTHPRPDCGWEAPYPLSADGDISRVEPLLDVASQYPNFIGVVNAHESFWTCSMSFDEMAGLKSKLKAYALSKGRDIQVWNYINSLYDESRLPQAQIDRIMDVAVTWKHCAGNAEGSCDSALAMINSDQTRTVGHSVELVYIIQTFTSTSPYTTRFTLNELEIYACEFLNTGGLSGFGFYTWEAGWWADLHEWPDLQPAVEYIHGNCVK
jgi:hypothetical protein